MTARHVLVLLAVVAFLAAGPANAAKEKFTRTKPHVNVGTIGQVEDSAGRKFTVFEAAIPEGESNLRFADKGDDVRVESNGAEITKVYLTSNGRTQPLHRMSGDKTPQGLSVPGCTDLVWFADGAGAKLIGFCAAGPGKRKILRATE